MCTDLESKGLYGALHDRHRKLVMSTELMHSRRIAFHKEAQPCDTY